MLAELFFDKMQKGSIDFDLRVCIDKLGSRPFRILLMMAASCTEFCAHGFVGSFDPVIARLASKPRDSNVGEGWGDGVLM